MEKSKSPELSKDILQQFGGLAGVKFSEARLERMVPRVGRYFEDVNRLEEVDVSEAEPVVIFSMERESSDGE